MKAGILDSILRAHHEWLQMVTQPSLVFPRAVCFCSVGTVAWDVFLCQGLQSKLLAAEHGTGPSVEQAGVLTDVTLSASEHELAIPAMTRY